MTKFEKTKILGERCKQLQCGSLPFVDIEDGEGYNEYLIANRELQEKKIPFIIRRPLPNGGSEYYFLSFHFNLIIFFFFFILIFFIFFFIFSSSSFIFKFSSFLLHYHLRFRL